ncbi:MAG: hypothetical protein NC311_06110 [Muribaculaceae bacterium]|nr:hypothetical protein [Muribaculaceae bacterium]
MNKLTMPMVAISVGFWAQFAVAGDYADIGKPMTAEQLYYNNCVDGYIVGGCTAPVDLSLALGDVVSDCRDWMTHVSCTQCKKGYEKYEVTCIPNNEQGFYMKDCVYDYMSDSEKQSSLFAYSCRCSEAFNETGIDGYLFSGCSTDNIKYKCDTGNKYYQSTSTIKCTVTTDSNGDFKFSGCRGCAPCNEDKELWNNSNTGYQRSFYKKLNINGDTATCDDVYNNKWRCAANYYGTTTNGTSGCNPCPTLESAGLTPVCNSSGLCPYVKSNPGSTQITQCYAGTWEPDMSVYLKDLTGTFHWMVEDYAVASYGECYYK